MKTKGIAFPLCLLLCLALAAPAAQADRPLITKEAIQLEDPPLPQEENIPGEQVEGACGAAIRGTSLYVSDYYHGLVESFNPSSGTFGAGNPFQLGSFLSAGIFPEGPCQIAFGPEGALYANLWHQSVIRLQPTLQTFDTEHSTGVAVDAEGNVYVNDRTHVNVYDKSGAKLQEVGLGNLKDAYGLAVFGKKLYVPDAGTGTIKVFEPQSDPLNPKQTIVGNKTPQKHFVSLIDTSVAIDPTNENVLVLDNLQPGYEHPEAAVDEFDSKGGFLDQYVDGAVDGTPSGLAVDPETGGLFLTSGNTEEANVFAYGPYGEGGIEAVEGKPEVAEPGEGGESAGAAVGETAMAAPGDGGEQIRQGQATRNKRAKAHAPRRRVPRHRKRHRPIRLSGARDF